MINKYLDYKRRKALDEQARSLWLQAAYEAIYDADKSVEEVVGRANVLLAHFYETFYRSKSS